MVHVMSGFCFAHLCYLTPQSNAFLEMASILRSAHRRNRGTGLLSDDSDSEGRKAWE